jgi:hypothetical protein
MMDLRDGQITLPTILDSWKCLSPMRDLSPTLTRLPSNLVLPILVFQKKQHQPRQTQSQNLH